MVFIRVKPAPSSEEFLLIHYLTRSVQFQKKLLKKASTGSIWTTTLFQLGDVGNHSWTAPFPIPPPDEQAAIVRYLDETDEKIQAYISAKEKLIALLEEQRQAIIHQAVTQGPGPQRRS